MEVDGSCVSTEVDGSFHHLPSTSTSMKISMEVNLLPYKLMQASMEIELLPWKLVEASVDVFRRRGWKLPWKYARKQIV